MGAPRETLFDDSGHGPSWQLRYLSYECVLRLPCHKKKWYTAPQYEKQRV